SAGGAATGAVGGGVLGGVLGLLVGVGAIIIPGIGPVVAGGVLASTLGIAGGTAAAGAGIGAATGGILGALIGMGVPHEDARYFERGVKEGGTIVTVDAGSRAEEAREALARHGATLGSGRGPHAWSGGMDTPPRAIPVDHTLVAAPGGRVTGPWTGDERRRRHHGRRRTDR
ncbi:MAG TPA: hypothetical protein VK012_02890, partial [Gemmatimonadales bacterium]|nr:hypothetical protein [Gemmatimonadales bacterium]